jgi:hypothetical protein
MAHGVCRKRITTHPGDETMNATPDDELDYDLEITRTSRRY